MEAYLDNAATTKPFVAVRNIVLETMEKAYGNPSSMHAKGFEAEKYVKDARKNIADSLKVEEKEIYFTSGGTESNNTALIGTALANKRQGNHIITTRIEHPSVHNPLLFLEEQGFEVSYLDVDAMGVVNYEQLQQLVTKDTILVSIMMVNNEVGSVEDIVKIGEMIRSKNPKTLFHVDAIQAYGKYKIYPKKMGIDLLSISGHKIHGPKGIGALYVRDKVKVKPLMLGGGQQKGMRSGTENVPGIAGFGVAAKEIYENHEEKIRYLYELKRYFIDKIQQIEGTTVNALRTPLEETAPHVVSVSFAGIKSEVLLHALEEKNVYVSAGSACASNHPALSGTLKAIGVKQELLDSTIRFSFSVTTKKEEIDYTIEKLREILPFLRRFVKR